uniref:Uncharacterized protein n=1 Tax=Anguilla anguilla TaxID=7936 RepID=A0A0E9XBF5_ANGAN
MSAVTLCDLVFNKLKLRVALNYRRTTEDSGVFYTALCNCDDIISGKMQNTFI